MMAMTTSSSTIVNADVRGRPARIMSVLRRRGAGGLDTVMETIVSDFCHGRTKMFTPRAGRGILKGTRLGAFP